MSMAGKKIAMLAAAMHGMTSLSGYGGGRKVDNKSCANPGCRKDVISSEYCCLKCAVEAKRVRNGE